MKICNKSHPGGPIIHFFDTTVDLTRIRMDKITMSILDEKGVINFYRFKVEFPRKHILLVPQDLLDKALDFFEEYFDEVISIDHKFAIIKSSFFSYGRIKFPDWLFRDIGVNPESMVMIFVREKGFIEIYEYQTGKELI